MYVMVNDQFPKNQIYLEGNFKSNDLNAFNGVQAISSSYPGYILTFATENHARSAIHELKKNYYDQVDGFKLLLPSLDSIFKKVITTGERENEKNSNCR